MISHSHLKTMSRWFLRIITFLLLFALVAVLAAHTPARAQEGKHEPEYSTESEEYKLACDDKIPNACNTIFMLIGEYKKFLQQKKEQKEKEQENMGKRNPDLQEFMDI